MKRKILAILAILLGLAGLGVLLYPSVSNWMEQAKQRRRNFLKKQAGWQIFFKEVSSNLVTELLNFEQSPLSLALIKVEC